MAIEDVGCEVLIVDQEFYVEYISHQTLGEKLDTCPIDKGKYQNQRYEEERFYFPNCIHHIIHGHVLDTTTNCEIVMT